MITIMSSAKLSSPDVLNTNEYVGKSTDTKPVDNVGNASSFYCMDNGELYMFDGDDKVWIKQ